MSAAASVRFAVALVAVGFGVNAVTVRAGAPPREKKAQPGTKAAQDARASVPLKPVAERTLPFMFGGFAGGGGGAEEAPELKPVTVYVVPPITVKAAKTWQILGQSIAFNFPQETPLEDVLKYLKSATSDEKEKQKGLSIYVDPIALQEAEKTQTSPVTLDLDDVPISLGLTLALRQLGLKFYVDPHGIVMIVSEGETEHLTDTSTQILEELVELRGQVGTAGAPRVVGPGNPALLRSLTREVAELKQQVTELQGMIKGLSEKTVPRPAANPGVR
jgi:hypothetical protein